MGESCMPPTYAMAEFCTRTPVHRYMCLRGQPRATPQHQAETCTLTVARPRFIQLSVRDAGIEICFKIFYYMAVVVVKSRLESHAARGYGDYAIYAIYCSLLVICFLSQVPPAVYMVMVLVYRYWKAKLPVSISYNCVLNYPWVSLLH